MTTPNHGTPAFVRRHPELPAFCRTRRQRASTVHLSRLRRLEWLVWLVLMFQLSTLLLLVTLLPSPAPTGASTSALAREQLLP